MIGPGSVRESSKNAEAPGVLVDAPVVPPAATDLLNRVRNGDREAAAELLRLYEPVLKRRIRGRLGAEMRRVVDSQDIVSTVARRLDRCVQEGRVKAASDAQLWCLLRQITDNAFKEKGRAFQRMRRCERGLAAAGESQTAREETLAAERARAAIGLLHRPEDMELAFLRSTGVNYARIARVMGISVTAARQRWTALRRRLSAALSPKGD